ncbi:hypothetical protein MLD38_006314 [Melastoma candidum]|uniref:Uncharacterized protein n=1 Tax=Melastoma candidum TaxID=119954 RepID=A0ACB9RRN5_9MYRT|nr:hypothetical protein MLD38_006314 [Melastoma candidum]
MPRSQLIRFIGLVKGLCKSMRQLRQLHAHFITNDSLLPPTVDPRRHTTSTFCYNTLIRAHTLLSHPSPALHLLVEMLRRPLPLDFHSFPFVLKACDQLRDLSFSRSLHSLAVRTGFGADVFFVNSLIRVYSTCGRTEDALAVFNQCQWKDAVSFNTMMDGLIKKGDVDFARELFDAMLAPDAVSWGTLVTGYSQTGQARQAIELFDCMMGLGVRPDNTTLVSVLSACAQLQEVGHGMRVHDLIHELRIEIDSFLCTGLVDMYAKCGQLEAAIEAFNESSERNVCAWNALLLGLAMHGQGQLAFQYFSRMTVDAWVQPDGVTILGVLVACSHSGLVEEACKIFEQMESVYSVVREPKHFGCMTDLLGRAGMVQEAVEMISGMPPNAGDIFVLGSLLAGCRKHENIKVAEKAAQLIIKLFPEDGGVYSVMADVYANANRWSDVVETRTSLSASAAIKSIGYSMIQPR